jgi:ribosomal protein S14
LKRDKLLRKKFGSIETRRLLLKAISCNEFLPLTTRKAALDSLKLIRFHGTKIHNICRITQRTRGVYRDFNIARSQFNLLAGYGLLPGVKKSSW